MNKDPEHTEQNSLEEVTVCDLCGKGRIEQELTANDWTLLKCTTCGLVFTSPRYTEEYLLRMYKDQYYENAPALFLSCQLQQPPEDLYHLAISIKKMLAPKNGTQKLFGLWTWDAVAGA